MTESMSRKIAKNAAVTSVLKYANTALTIVVAILFNRWMSLDFLDQFQTVMVFIVLFGCVSDLGYDAVILREYSKRVDEQSKLLFHGFLIRLVLCAVATILCCVAVLLSDVPDQLRWIVYIYSLSLLLTVWPVFQVPFKEKNKFIVPMLMAIGIGLLPQLAKLVLAFYSSPLLTFFLMFLAFEAMKCFIIWVYYKCNSPVSMVVSFDFKYMKSLLWIGLPMALFALVSFTSLHVDKYMITQLDKEEGHLANYALAVRLSELIFFLVGSILVVTTPIWAKYAETDKDRLVHMVKRIQKYLTTILAPMVIFFAFFSQDFLNLIFPANKFYLAGEVLPLLIVAAAMWTYYSIGYFYFFALNKEKYILPIAALAALVNIVVNFYFIQYYDIFGAGLATLLSYSFSYFCFIAIKEQRTIMFDNLIQIWLPLIVAGLLIVPIWYWNIYPAYLAISAIMYLPLLRLLKHFDQEDLVIIKSIMRR